MLSYISPGLSLVALIVASDRDSLDCGNVGVLLRCSRLISLKIPIDVLLRYINPGSILKLHPTSEE